MGCGLVSQRGLPLEVGQPLTADAHDRPARSRSTSNREHADVGAHVARRELAASGEHGSRLVPGPAGGSNDGTRVRMPSARRFVTGDRGAIVPRLPGNVQDHAFCFECGTFFQISAARAPQCARCGSSFVQFLRGGSDRNWISADSSAGMSFSFDDQLETSLSASLDEAPTSRKPTQVAFLRNLPTSHLDASQVEERAAFGAADPRCYCAICREAFVAGDALKQMPCNHEFHQECIVTWLQSNNTCPICRWRCPEATEGDDECGDVPVECKFGVGNAHAAIGQGIASQVDDDDSSSDVQHQGCLAGTSHGASSDHLAGERVTTVVGLGNETGETHSTVVVSEPSPG